MKKITSLILLAGFSMLAWGQNTNKIESTGNVGIGTITPGAKLDVNGVIRTYNIDNNTATWDNLSLWSDGSKSFIHSNGDENGLWIKSKGGNRVVFDSNVEVNASLSGQSLKLAHHEMVTHITCDMYGRSHEILFNAYRFQGGWMTNATKYTHSSGGYAGGAGAIRFIGNGGQIDFFISKESTNANDIVDWGIAKMTIKRNGFVGIGREPQNMLDVAGTIRATEIKVEAQTADFVFEDNYHLKDLSEVEAFIKANKHLPEVPSAAEMEATGVNLAEMNKLLLMKVEELTLYSIEQEKKIEARDEKVESLELKVEELRKMEERLAQLESLLSN